MFDYLEVKKIFFFLCFLSCLHVQAEVQPLVLLNWADYMDPEILAKFSQQTGIEVKEVYFDSDEGRDELMATSSGKGYDLIIVNGVAIEQYTKQNWLQAIPSPAPNNFSHIDLNWSEAFPSSKKYAVPFFWGTLGIAYRSDLVTSPITQWHDIFQPKEELKGKITLMNSAREVIAASLKSLGYSTNTTDKKEFQQAIKLMQQQAPHVNSYNYIDLDETSSLLTGETFAAMMYSGDALTLQEVNENIEYVLPEEGGNIWIDYFAVSASSNQKDNAWKFINFLNQPKIAAHLAEYLYYASPNKAARKLLDEEFLSDKVIFPDQSSLKNSEFFKPLPPRQLKKLNKSFQQLVN